MESFNPEFHWQREQKVESRKTFLKIFLVLFFVFAIVFLVKKTFFVPEKNISLLSLVPDSSKVVLDINKFDSATRRLNQQNVLNYIKLFTGDELRARGVISKLNKEFLWTENSSSQAILIKTASATFLESDIFASKKLGEMDSFNRKVGYSEFYFDDNNLFVKKDKIYFVKLNEYTFCISNDLNYLGEVITKYDSLKKNKFKKSIIVNQLDTNTYLTLEIKDYDLSTSGSFVKKLAFLNNALGSNFGKLELNFSQNSIDVYLSNSNFDKSKVLKQANNYYLPEIYNNSFYYKNFSDEKSMFTDVLSSYVSLNINSNVDISKEILNIKNLGIIIYKNGNFLINTNDLENISTVFKRLLSVLKPSTRGVALPDGTYMSEYYANPNTIDLKEFNDGNFVWYFDDLPEKINSEMVKCFDNLFISSDKTKILNLCTNRDKLSVLFGKRYEGIGEVIFVSPEKPLNIPIIGSIKQILSVNFDEKDNKVLFFKLLY